MFNYNTGNAPSVNAHRSAVAAADFLAVPAQPTVADVATGGSLVFNTAYKIAVAAGNRYGTTTPSTVASITTANDAASTHVVRVTVAQVAGAEGYHIFLSIDAAPKYVGYVTEAQRAAGGCRITAMGTVDVLGANAAGTVDVKVVGTGAQTSAAPFLANNAVLLPTGLACGGYTQALAQMKLNLSDLRSQGSYTVDFYTQNATGGDFFYLTTQTVTPGAAGTPQLQALAFDLSGAKQLAAAVRAISGQGATLDVTVTLG